MKRRRIETLILALVALAAIVIAAGCSNPTGLSPSELSSDTQDGNTATPDGVASDESQNLEAELSLDSNITADSPATVTGDTAWVTGVSGDAMEFDQDGEFISLPDSDSLDLSADATVEAWIYPHPGVQAAAGILHKGAAPDFSDEAYSLQYNNVNSSGDGQVAFIITNDAGTHTYVISSEYVLHNSQWNHIVVAWDTTDVYLYVNGVLLTDRQIYQNGWKTSIPAGFAPARNSDGALLIGSQLPEPNSINSDGYYGFNGIIDEVALYSRILDASEVEDHYNALAPL